MFHLQHELGSALEEMRLKSAQMMKHLSANADQTDAIAEQNIFFFTSFLPTVWEALQTPEDLLQYYDSIGKSTTMGDGCRRVAAILSRQYTQRYSTTFGPSRILPRR